MLGREQTAFWKIRHVSSGDIRDVTQRKAGARENLETALLLINSKGKKTK